MPMGSDDWKENVFFLTSMEYVTAIFDSVCVCVKIFIAFLITDNQFCFYKLYFPLGFTRHDEHETWILPIFN